MSATTNTRPTAKANAEAIEELRSSVSAIAQGVATLLEGQQAAQQASKPKSQPKAATRQVNIVDPKLPASRRQRKALMAITGIYPNDKSGWAGLTKGAASKAISDLNATGRAVVEVAAEYHYVDSEGTEHDEAGAPGEREFVATEWHSIKVEAR